MGDDLLCEQKMCIDLAINASKMGAGGYFEHFWDLQTDSWQPVTYFFQKW